MAEQYFTNNPTSEHEYQDIKLELADIKLNLRTDSGVFSKNRVDYGSLVLLQAVLDTDLQLPAGKILDLGTGYGPMGLTLAKTYPEREIVMVDVNERALELARANATANSITNVEIKQSDIYQNVTEQFALIVTNPPIRAGKQVVNQIHEAAYQHLVSGGQLITVLQKKQGAPSAKKLLQETFGNVEVLSRDKGYYILRSIKD